MIAESSRNRNVQPHGTRAAIAFTSTTLSAGDQIQTAESLRQRLSRGIILHRA